MAWKDENWQQNEEINNGFPYPVGLTALAKLDLSSISTWQFSESTNNGYPYWVEQVVFDYNGVYTPWKFSESTNKGYPYCVEQVVFDYDSVYTPWKFNSDTISNFPCIVEPIMMGAFNYCYNLKEVVIPESVKYIGPYAFWRTALTEATIAPDCKYFEHSFPFGCKIKFYGEGENNFITKDEEDLLTIDRQWFNAKG